MKKVAVIQDLSSFGKCSLTAAIPVLSVMGVQPCPLPTAVLTAQTEYPSYYCKDLTEHMPQYIAEWQKLHARFDGIYTGYVTGEQQIDYIFTLLDAFYKDGTTLLVDPVMGDMGEGYDMLTNPVLERMRELTTHADIIIPNVTECCFLTGISYDRLQQYSSPASYVAAVTEAGQQLAAQTNAQVIITGVLESTAQRVGNIYIGEGQVEHRSVHYNGMNYSGTGDLFASVVMGSIMRGQSMAQAFALAENFIEAAIAATSKTTTPAIAGVQFESQLYRLFA